jgi:hypothetical protein
MAGASDNGGRSPDDMPDLPEEWGVIVIPDDLSELDDEVRAIRAELHLSEHPSRWRRFLQHPAGRRVHRVAILLLRAPVLIVSLAVLVTIASLFASAWPGPPRGPATQRTSGSTAEPVATTLPALELIGADGQPVALNADLPAVIMLIDGCDCTQLINDTIAAVPPSIAVITVSAAAAASAVGTPPTGATPQAQGKTVRMLHDPTSTVRTTLKLPPPGETFASVLLVNKGGAIIRTLRTATVELIKPDLARL